MPARRTDGPGRTALRGSPPENYQRYFVPAIGAPVAEDLIKAADLHPGERVLDVACGTGVAARLATARVGDGGQVAGLDVNPGMLAVARAETPAGMRITWHEGRAEQMPLPDAAFDVVLCQMGLQFMTDKRAALDEMRRVLAPGGRIVLNVPGPTPPAFALLAETLGERVAPEAAGFVTKVFSLHDAGEIRSLLTGAAFQDVTVESKVKTLPIPSPSAFLWQYVYSTPLAAVVASTTDERLAQIERDVVGKWKPLVVDDVLPLRVRMVTATAHKA